MKEALKLALEALRMADELCRGHGVDFKEYGLEFDRDIQVKYKDAITAIKAALAQPEQEPKSVTYKEVADAMNAMTKGTSGQQIAAEELGKLKLYTTPPQRPWVGLTEKQIEIIEEMALTKQWAIRMTIEQLKECNA